MSDRGGGGGDRERNVVPDATSGVSLIQQIEIVEGVSALVVLVIWLWLLGTQKLVIGSHYDEMRMERDFWKNLYLDRLRNGPRGKGEG